MPLQTHNPYSDEYNLSKYNAFVSFEEQMTADIAEMAKRNQERLLDLRDYLQGLSHDKPGSVPLAELREADSLYSKFDDVRELKPTGFRSYTLHDRAQLHCALTDDLMAFSKRAIQRLRVGCFWQAAPIYSPSVAISSPSYAPPYLLRAQVKACNAKCAYHSRVGIISAKFDPMLPRSLDKTTEEYRQHLRFHCNGWYQKRGPTTWISLSDDPTWMVDQIPQYRWRTTGHQIAFINTQRLADLGIPFARSSDLVLEAKLKQWRSHHNNLKIMPWDVVKFATESHWLVFAWIPDSCITWVELDDFVAAHDSLRTGQHSIYAPSSTQILDEVHRLPKFGSVRSSTSNEGDATLEESMQGLRLSASKSVRDTPKTTGHPIAALDEIQQKLTTMVEGETKAIRGVRDPKVQINSLNQGFSGAVSITSVISKDAAAAFDGSLGKLDATPSDPVTHAIHYTDKTTQTELVEPAQSKDASTQNAAVPTTMAPQFTTEVQPSHSRRKPTVRLPRASSEGTNRTNQLPENLGVPGFSSTEAVPAIRVENGFPAESSIGDADLKTGLPGVSKSEPMIWLSVEEILAELESMSA